MVSSMSRPSDKQEGREESCHHGGFDECEFQLPRFQELEDVCCVPHILEEEDVETELWKGREFERQRHDARPTTQQIKRNEKK